MYPYKTLPDKTKVTHSHLLGEGEELSVEVLFERSKTSGLASARFSIPSHEWVSKDGFTDDEIAGFERMCKESAHVFLKQAELRMYCCEQQFY